MEENKAAEYRRTAQLCAEMAERMHGASRIQMLLMVRRWQAIADQAEADGQHGHDHPKKNRG